MESKTPQCRGSYILVEPDLTLTKSVDIALALECAVRDAETNGESGSKIHQVKANHKPKASQGAKVEASLTCYRCGFRSHKASECKFKEFTCHRCGKKGHIKRACRSPQSPQKKKSMVKHISETLPTDESIQPSEYELYKVTSGTSGHKPFEVELELDGHPVIMEIDTGASKSVIPWKVYKEKFTKKPLEETSLQLKTYDGQLLEVKGTIIVQVVQGTSKALLPLIVVNSSGPSLLGRDWLKSL